MERDTELVDLVDDPADPLVTVRTRTADGAGRSRRARYVIGADGAHSTVRSRIGATFDGAPHEGAFFLADTAVDWDRGYGDALTVALDSGGGMALFVPMADPGGDPHRFRVFGSLGADGPDGSAITLADVQRRLDTGARIPTRLHDPRWIAVYRLHSRMADVFARGRVFLAGDAAHIHTPTGGQGMNTGIQDAHNLAWKLSAVVRGHARPRLLESYAIERQSVARALLAGTDAAFATITANGRTTRVVRPVVAALLPTVLRIPAVGRRAFRTISQITVRYPGSPAVAGDASARAARPGDRAPHAELRRGAGTVFDLLTGTDHHLLLLAADHPAPDGARAAAQRVLDSTPTPVRVHLLGPDEHAVHRAYDARRPTMLLVRPDGHVAWRGDPDDTAGLAAHLDRWYRTGPAPAAPAGAPPLPPPGTYRVDPARSTLTLRVAHWFGRGTVTATVPLTTAILTITDDPEGARARAEVDATGFRSGNRRRNRTVTSSRLLDAASWPTIDWSESGLRWHDGAWRMAGILTGHGRSTELDLRTRAVTPTADGSWTVTGDARLDRHALGITGLPGVVGRSVALDLTLHASPVPTRSDPVARTATGPLARTGSDRTVLERPPDRLNHD